MPMEKETMLDMWRAAFREVPMHGYELAENFGRRVEAKVMRNHGDHQRWNIDEEPDGSLRICKGDHPSGDGCRWIHYKVTE